MSRVTIRREKICKGRYALHTQIDGEEAGAFYLTRGKGCYVISSRRGWEGYAPTLKAAQIQLIARCNEALERLDL